MTAQSAKELTESVGSATQLPLIFEGIRSQSIKGQYQYKCEGNITSQNFDYLKEKGYQVSYDLNDAVIHWSKPVPPAIPE